MSKSVSQAEYIRQKYLNPVPIDEPVKGINKTKKKVKKRRPDQPAKFRLRIFDDDIDLEKLRPPSDDETDRFATHEEKPMVAAVIDDRPEHLKKKGHWKSVSEKGDGMLDQGSNSYKSKFDREFSIETHGKRSKISESIDEDDDYDLANIRKGNKIKFNSKIEEEAMDEDEDYDLSRIRSIKGKKTNLDGFTQQSSSFCKNLIDDDGGFYLKDRIKTERNDSVTEREEGTLRKKPSGNRESDRRLEDCYSRSDRKPHYSDPEEEYRSKSRHAHRESRDQSNRRGEKRKDGVIKDEPMESRRRLMEKTPPLSSKEKQELLKRLFDKKEDSADEYERFRLMEEEEENRKKEAELKKRYDQWSRGVKQSENSRQQREEAQNEIEKPLARYENDTDRDRYLRERELKEDPMIEYIRKKKQIRAAKESLQRNEEVRIFPKYSGKSPSPQNRFGIMPGYRWDGVDRSNGYETKLLNKRNDVIANQEEAYKWSSMDM